ncbi:MAG: HhoA/HhoB/HtrA family serine endopeptidase [Elainellaceae cyanobacterium]
MKLNDSSSHNASPSGEHYRGTDANQPVTKSSRSPLRRSITYLALLVLGAGTAIAGEQLLNTPAPAPRQAPAESEERLPLLVEPQTAVAPSPSEQINNPNFIADAVAKVGPAVVRIDAQRTVSSQRSPQIFQDPFGRMFEGEAPFESPRVEEGTGSGFIIDANGLILTNTHVIDGADRVSVVLKDGRRFDGEVLGQDPATDVAVVKIEATDLPIVTVGNSDQLQPGEWAIAIGNPLGLDNTVTAGIVSATGRSSAEIGVSDRRVGFIQTDAAINPGNSGGPLLNQQGEVIGMNTAIISGAQGLGFAVPINTAQRIANQLITEGRVEHPYLGVRMVSLSPEIKEQLNASSESRFTIQAEEGILVVEVVPDSPAAQAGIQQGDVIISMDGQSVEDAATVQRIVEGSQIGEALPIEIQRGEETLNLSVTPGILPNES